MSTTMLKRDLGMGDLCDNIGLVGVSAKWSYVTASPSHHDQAIPILSPLLFMHVGHPYIPFLKFEEFTCLNETYHARLFVMSGRDPDADVPQPSSNWLSKYIPPEVVTLI